MSAEITDDDLAVMFIAPMDAPGVNLAAVLTRCRRPRWARPSTIRSSRFDENDAIFVFDDVFIPWEDVLVHRNIEMLMKFYPSSGFNFTHRGCTRLTVKLDFVGTAL